MQTLVPRLLRKVAPVPYQRERITTPDDDFLELDWARDGRDRLAILLHGLEGCSRSHYIQGLVQELGAAGWDGLVLNFRGCGGEMNRRCRLYHSGETGDLHTVIGHAAAQPDVNEIALVGVSLGGNVTLKYLGEHGAHLHRRIRRAVAISVPCDLTSSAAQLARFSNRVYMRYFLSTLARKARIKATQFPGIIRTDGLGSMRTFADFDGRVTAPLHGFASAEEYWRLNSSRPFIPFIRVPTLLLNARNDPFLTPACFPEAEARANDLFHLEAPAGGGHVGFAPVRRSERFWSEQRVVEFLAETP